MERPEEIWFLMSRNLSGEASAEEKEALMQAIQQEPGLMQQYELMQRLWKPGSHTGEEEVESRVSNILRKSAIEAQQEQEITETSLQTGEPSIEMPPVRTFRMRTIYMRLAIAASLLIIAVASWYMFTDRHPENSGIIAKKGSKTRTILPDGSTVWLNAGSSLQYDPNFSGSTREVTLQGEAYFDVVKMPQKPFIVHAGEINIRVLGTAFNVKSYAEEENIETTLIRGLVQITRQGAGQEAPLYLHPNQKIVIPRTITHTKESNTEKEITGITDKQIIHLDSSLHENEHFEIAWVYNRLEFRGETFEELAQKLERWYNITIHFEDAAVRKLPFNGSLENETVEQAFSALAAAVPFTFRVHEHDIYISTIKTNP